MITFTDAAIAAGAAPVTITYSEHLAQSVTPGELLTNTATATDSTQPTGGYTQPAVTAQATVPVDLTPTEAKTILALSNAFSTTQVVTGETVTYQLVTTLQPGTQEFRLADTLPAGLTFTSATVASVGANVTGVTPGAVTATAGVFDFGTVVAAPGTAASDQVVVDITATVAQVAGGTTFINTATAEVTAPGSTTTGLETGSSTAPTLTDVKSSLSGTVFTDNNDDGVLDQADSGLAGVTVQLLDGTGAQTGATTTTDANGHYSFGGLEVGTYSVQVVAPGADGFSPVGTNPNPATDSIVDATGKTAPVTLNPGADTPNQNAGVYAPVTLSGTVFNDRNADGSQQAGDTGVAGDTVQLLDGTGHPIPGVTTTTDANGNYSFTGLKPGTYAVQVTDPAGDSFSPVGTSGTAPNSIVNGTGATPPVTLASGQSATAQDAGVYGPGSLSGTVFTDNNDDGVIDGADKGLAGVTVRLLDSTGAPTGAIAVTDANGNYSFTGLHPANYEVHVVAPAGDGFSPVGTNANPALDSIVNGAGTTTAVAVSSNADTPNQNAGVYVPASIAGVVFTDQNADGVKQAGDTGIAGDTVTLLSGGTTVATTTTAADGSYSFPGLMPGSYTVQVTDPAGDTFSPPATGNPPVDSVVNGTGATPVITLGSGQTAPYENAGAFAPATLTGHAFFDTNADGQQEAGEANLPGVTVTLLDANGHPAGTTTTAADGSYSFTGLTPGSYSVQFTTPNGDLISPVGHGPAAGDSIVDGAGTTPQVTLTSGQTVGNQNAGFYQVGSLSGTVFTDNNDDGVIDGADKGLGGVTVQLLDGTGHPTGATATTDAAGHYTFTGVIPGNYSVQVVAPAGDGFSPKGTNPNPALDSMVGSTGATSPVSVTASHDTPNQNAGVYAPVSLTGTVFNDLNADGTQEAGDKGVAGDTVTLLDGNGNPTGATATTDANGFYSFTGLPPGSYAVQVADPAGDIFSPKGTSATLPNSIVGTTGATTPVTLASGQSATAQDAGVHGPASLSGTVFLDQNADGIKEAGDTGLAGQTVTLLDAGGNPTGLTTTTDASGNYAFLNLLPGTYSVAVTPVAGDRFSPVGGPPSPVDSIVDAAGHTAPVSVQADQNVPNQNAGEYAPATLSGHAFFDTNADGQQEAGEPNQGGVTVTLLDSAGHSTGITTTTAADGSYSFTGLMPGSYSVQFTTPNGDLISPVGHGPAAGDSIVDGAGTTPQVTLTSGQTVGNQNAGFYQVGSLSGTVFTDNNDDGVIDGADKGLGGVTVQLLDGTGHPTGATATTDAAGHYTFTGVIPGSYSVQVVAPAGDGFSPKGTNPNPALDSMVGSTGATSPVSVTASHDTPNQNAGVYAPGGISGNVFLDQNADGAKQPTDSNVPGQTVNLLNGTGMVIATTTTDANGNYSFQNLTPGSYDVQVVPPGSDRFSPPGTSATLEDSVVDATGKTPPITITSGLQVTGQNAGEYGPAIIQGTAFLDAHCDGTDDYGDPAFKGVTVKLFDGAGHFTGLTATTDAAGHYSFGSLTPGQYQVQFVAPLGTSFAAERVGSDNTINSDANAHGFSEVFTIASGQVDATRGVGFGLTGGYSNSPTTYLNATQTASGGNGGSVTIIGGSGPQYDILDGGAGDNILVGGMGNNTIEGGYGTNIILGGCGPFAQIQGLGQNDFIFGGTGNDLIQVHSGNEFVALGVGNQQVAAAGGHNTFISNANSGTIGYSNGVFTGVTLGDRFTTSGSNTDIVYNKGDGVIQLDNYQPANGDTLQINGYAAPTAVGFVNGYNVLYFGPDAAVLFSAGGGPVPANGVVPGVTYNAALPTTAPLTISVDANGYLTLQQAGAATPIFGPGPGPTLTGAVAGQATTGQTPVTPFFGVHITDPGTAQTETLTVSPFSQGYGSFANLGAGSVSNGTYSVTGTAAAVTAAVDALQFVPTLSGIGVGQSLTAQFTLAVTDTAGFSASNSTTTLTETRAALPPVIAGTLANQPGSDTATLHPFATTTVTDLDGGQLETATVKLSSTANGTLGNLFGGTYDAAAGTVTVSSTAQGVTAILQQLTFTPVAHEAAAGSTVTTAFGLTVLDGLGDTASDSATSVAVQQTAAPVVPAPVMPAPVVPAPVVPVPPAPGAPVVVTGVSPYGSNTVTLGAGNHTVSLTGYFNTVTLGAGTNTVDAGYDATVNATGGNQTVVLSGYNNLVNVTGNATASVTGGSGLNTVKLGTGTGTVNIAGYSNTVDVGAGTDTIDAGFGAHIEAAGGMQDITLHGYNSMVFIGGSATATIGGGDGSSQITTTSGSATIGLNGYSNVVTTGGSSDTITDSAQGFTRINVGGGAQPGLEILQNFGANANSVVNVLGASAAGLTADSLLHSLTTNAAGSAQLTLPSNAGTVVFSGLTPNQLHASNFQAG